MMREATKKAIEGKVAKILNDRELVINRGSNDGIEIGDRFKVIDENEDIIDPDTGQSIGSIIRDKVRVKIVHVQSSLSIGRTYETYQQLEREPYSSILRDINPRYITRVKTLRVPGHTSATDADIQVNVGDKAVQVDEFRVEASDLSSEQLAT